MNQSNEAQAAEKIFENITGFIEQIPKDLIIQREEYNIFAYEDKLRLNFIPYNTQKGDLVHFYIRFLEFEFGARRKYEDFETKYYIFCKEAKQYLHIYNNFDEGTTKHLTSNKGRVGDIQKFQMKLFVDIIQQIDLNIPKV
jgi:hypothetical protein